MGVEQRTNDLVEVKKRISAAAAEAMQRIHQEHDAMKMQHRVLAREMQELHRLVQTAAAAFDEPRKKYAETLERLENVSARVRAFEERLTAVDAWQTARTVSRGSIFVARLVDAEMQTFDERVRLSAGWRARLPWRRRRVADLSRQLEVLVGVRLALGIALPTERAAAVPPPAQRVIE